MKKMLEAVLSIILVCLMGVSVSANATTEVGESGHNNHATCFEHGTLCDDLEIGIIVNEIPVSNELLREAYNQGLLPMESKSKLRAACAHTYSAWSTVNAWLADSVTFGECKVRVKTQIRYCTKCNDAQGREVTEQLSHVWKPSKYGKKCSRCGDEIGNMRK